MTTYDIMEELMFEKMESERGIERVKKETNQLVSFTLLFKSLLSYCIVKDIQSV